MTFLQNDFPDGDFAFIDRKYHEDLGVDNRVSLLSLSL